MYWQYMYWQIFGYELIELPGNKYILVNEIKNEMPHICPTAKEGRQQVLLFIVLTHIFMHEECCSEGINLVRLILCNNMYTKSAFK